MKIIATILVTLLVLAGVLLIMIYTGRFDVAATEPHAGITQWVLNTAMENGVRKRAAEVRVPELTEDMVASGAATYGVMCVTCHGAPGVARSAIGDGLNPMPPELSEEAGEWTPAELYWIIKNGIKMTGMPAFGPSHGEDKLWALVAFVDQLPELTAEEYRSLGMR